MPRRPFPIIIISLIYLISPFFIIIQTAYIHRIPIIGYHNIFSLLLLSDIIILFLYIICSVSIFFTKKWGWYTFILISIYMINYNIIVFILNKQYNIFILLTYNLLLTILGGIFFQKNIITPFFNPKIRWWETEPRLVIDFHIELIEKNDKNDKNEKNNKYKAEVFNISKAGCFIISNDILQIGKKYSAIMTFMKNVIKFKVKVIRKSSSKEILKGYGIKFIDLLKEEKKSITKIINDLDAANLKDIIREDDTFDDNEACYNFSNTVTFMNRKNKIQGLLLNLSKNGCEVSLQETLILNKIYNFSIMCLNASLNFKGEIKWKKDANFYGIKFINLTTKQKKLVNKILINLKRLGSYNRLKIAAPLSKDIIEKYALNSPYKKIEFIKRSIFK